jgi:Leucine-rich repeat (LRR) protein
LRFVCLSGKKSSQLPENFVSFCKKCTVCVINISKNLITNLPKEIETLDDQITEFIYSLNQLEIIPINLYKLTNLIRLDLRGNFLTEIQRDISKLEQLRELVIADNRLI